MDHGAGGSRPLQRPPVPGGVADGWLEASGSGNEEGLEVVADALCRQDGAAADCWDDPGPLTPADEGTLDFWRADAAREAWIVSDEGDSSRRISAGDADAGTYVDLYEEMGAVAISVVGPSYVDGDASCLSGAQTWGVERYQDAADRTHGDYASLTSGPSDCALRDVGALLVEFAKSAAA